MNADVQCVVLLKACRKCFKPYMYFAAKDILITTEPISVDDPALNFSHLMGLFYLYLILNRCINRSWMGSQDYVRSGWMESFKETEFGYVAFLSP